MRRKMHGDIVTEAEHAQILADEQNGLLQIGIDRPLARQFFATRDIKAIAAETGEAPFAERLILSAFAAGDLLGLLASACLSIYYFHWWSVAVIPSILLVRGTYVALSLRGNSGIGLITLLAVAVIAILVFNPAQWPALPFFVAAVSMLWFVRAAHILTVVFVRALIIRNSRAYNLFSEAGGITIRETPPS